MDVVPAFPTEVWYGASSMCELQSAVAHQGVAGMFKAGFAGNGFQEDGCSGF